MTLEDAYETLKGRYGNHSAVARALEINTSYYRDIRNGRAKPSRRLQKDVISTAFGPEAWQEFCPNGDVTSCAATLPNDANLPTQEYQSDILEGTVSYERN